MTTTLVQANELHKVDPVFGQLSFDNHEQIVFCHDKDTGLKAIIGIHNTVLGPALGERACGNTTTSGKHSMMSFDSLEGWPTNHRFRD